MIKRRKTNIVKIGNVCLGWKFPVVIQSMTNTLTSDIKATVKQIKELADAGSELVRVTINDEATMQSVPDIIRGLRKHGYELPIIGDFHFNAHKLLTNFPQSAVLLAKYRINPGNVGRGQQHDENFAAVIKVAVKNNKPVRIGVNGGSLDQDLFSNLLEKNRDTANPKSLKEVMYKTVIQSALSSARFAEELGLPKDKIVLSAKMSDVQDLIKVNELLASKCDYVLHLGLTEAGGNIRGLTASSVALGVLLQQGIGDTIRISLTPEPGASRTKEVFVCQYLLQSLHLRYFRPTVISCPGCGRTLNDTFLKLAAGLEKYIDSRLVEWKKKYTGIEELHIAVMGCVVNGPGESKAADIGICLPGVSEKPVCIVFTKGKVLKKLYGENIAAEFFDILERFLRERFYKTC